MAISFKGMKLIEVREKYLDKIAQEGINTKAQFYAALPVLMAAKEKLEALASTNRIVSAMMNEGLRQCGEYAERHPSVFENGFIAVRENRYSGEIVIDDTTYTLTRDQKDFNRIDGNNKTAEFMNGLPGDWVRSHAELNKTVLRKKTAEELAEHGLEANTSYTWTDKTVTGGDNAE